MIGHRSTWSQVFGDGLAGVLLAFEATACNSIAPVIIFLGLSSAGVAQLVEHLICNQRVGGSTPSAS
jgi:hypothetical protein